MGNEKFKILVVDDDAELREILVSILESNDFKVLSAESGAKAFEIAKNETIDLILSDIQMSEMDGMELIKKVKGEVPAVPLVVFMTGFHDYSDEECIKSGARQVIRKPFDANKIVEIVCKALGL